MSETKTIELDSPIARGDTAIGQVEIRKPSAGELRGLSLASVLQMEVDSLVRLLPRITSPALTEADVRKMDPADLVQAGTEVAGFLLTKRARGEEPTAYLTA